MEDQLSPTGCGVDTFLQRFETHSPLMKLGNGVDEVPERAAKPIQPPDN